MKIKKREKIRKKEFNDKLETLLQKMLFELAEKDIELLDERSIDIFEKYEFQWKDWVRRQIHRKVYNYIFNNSKNRKIVLEHFREVFESIVKQKEEELKSIKDGEITNDLLYIGGKGYTANFLLDIYKSMGVNTRAKTLKGLFRVYQSLNETQKKQFREFS